MAPGTMKTCFVPGCRNTSATKVMLTVPNNEERRKMWFFAAGWNRFVTSALFCCEDHFDLSEDAQNYLKVKLMGGRIIMKPGVVPHKNLGANRAGTTGSHFLSRRSQLKDYDDVGNVVGVSQSPQQDNHEPEIRELERLEDIAVIEDTTPADSVGPPAHEAPAYIPMRLPRTLDRRANRTSAVKRKPGAYVVTEPGPFKRPRPRILRGSAIRPKKPTDSNGVYFVGAKKSVKDQFVSSGSPRSTSEHENIVVVVDRLNYRVVGNEDHKEADPLAESPDALERGFGYHFLMTDAMEPTEEPSENQTTSFDPTADQNVCACADGTAEKARDLAHVFVKEENLFESDDVVAPSKEENGDTSGSNRKQPKERSSESRTSDPNSSVHAGGAEKTGDIAPAVVKEEPLFEGEAPSAEESDVCSCRKQPAGRTSENRTPNPNGSVHGDGVANGNSAGAPLEDPPDSDDDTALSDEGTGTSSSSEDEFSPCEPNDEDSEEERCDQYFRREAMYDLYDLDVIDGELHECIKRCEEEYGGKSEEEAAEHRSKNKGEKETKLNGTRGSNDRDLLVYFDSKTIYGQAKDGGDFIWQTLPCRATPPETDRTPEPVCRDVKEPLDCFLLFFSNEMMESLIPRTNERIAGYRRKKRRRSPTHADIGSSAELRALVGLLLLAAVRRDNHLPLSVIFDVEALGTCYSSVMSLQRFRFLLRSLRFGGEHRTESSRVEDFWETFVQNCRSNYRPGRNLTVGHRVTRECRSGPSKRHARHIFMVDSSTKYVFSALSNNLTSATLRQLTDPVKSSNRTITFQTPVSIQWVLDLNQNGLTSVGIVNPDDSELPSSMWDPSLQNRDVRSSLFIYRDDMTSVSYKTSSTKVVCYVSSVHGEPKLVNEKPEIIVSYNSNKNAVQTFDKILTSVSCARRTKRRTLGYFFTVLSIACHNAYVVYLHNVYKRLCGVKVEPSEDREKPLSRFDFVAKLFEQLTREWVQQRQTERPASPEELGDRLRRSPAVKALAVNLVDVRTLMEGPKSSRKCDARCSETDVGET